MIVTVDALFSHNNRVGSKIISHGTKHLAKYISHSPSHVAVLINERWVHESTMSSGVRVLSYDKWCAINEEIARIPLKPREYQLIADNFRSIKGKPYDWKGIAYFCMAMLPTFIGCSLPKKNRWQSDDAYFCCEVLGEIENLDYEMSPPILVLHSLLREYL